MDLVRLGAVEVVALIRTGTYPRERGGTVVDSNTITVATRMAGWWILNQIKSEMNPRRSGIQPQLALRIAGTARRSNGGWSIRCVDRCPPASSSQPWHLARVQFRGLGLV
jgi:hypothetical protein